MPAANDTFRIVLVGLGALAIAVAIGRFAFTPLLPLMESEGLLSIFGGGVLASANLFAYCLGALVAAWFPLSPKLVFRLSVIAIAISTLGMGLTESFALWLIFRAVAGLAGAFILVLVSSYFLRGLAERGRPELQGWVFSGVGAGIAITGLGAVAIMTVPLDSFASWQAFGMVTFIFGATVCVWVGPELPGVRPQWRRSGDRRSPLNWGVVIAYGTFGMGYIIPATYLPVVARATVTDPLVFGWAWPVFGAAACLSTVLVARLQPRFSNRQVWVVSQLILAFGLILPVVYPHIVTIQIAGFCVGGTFMIITMVGMKEAHRLAPAEDVVRHVGVMTAAFATGQMVGPVFASALHDLTGGFALSLVVTSVALVLTLVPLIANSAKKEAISP